MITTRYLAKRLVVSYLTLLVIMTIPFVLVRSMPGFFITSMITPEMKPVQIERPRKMWWLIPPELAITSIAAAFYFIGFSVEDVANPWSNNVTVKSK